MDTTENNTVATELPHTFSAYDSQLPIALGTGERAVKCLYKLNKATGKTAGVNSYIVIPEGHISESVVVENIAKLAPFVSAFLQDEEDKIVKQFHKEGGKGFASNWLSLQKILDTLEAAGQGNRLNKEKIETWFSAEMKESLVAAFAEKLGVSDVPSEAELEKLAQITSVYRAKFASLASGKTMYRVEEAELMQKALEVTEADKSVIGEKFYNRLEKMKTATPDDLLLSL